MELQVGVKALLANKEGKYLLVRRSSKKYPEVGARWDIVGGRINPGETLMENLRREVKEEVNLEIRNDPKLVAAQDILRVPGRHVVRLTFVGEADGTPHLDDDHTEFKWVTAEDMRGMENLDIYVKELIEKKILLNW